MVIGEGLLSWPQEVFPLTFSWNFTLKETAEQTVVSFSKLITMLACGKLSEGPFWSCSLVLPWLDMKSLGEGLECQVKYWLYIDVSNFRSSKEIKHPTTGDYNY